MPAQPLVLHPVQRTMPTANASDTIFSIPSRQLKIANTPPSRLSSGEASVMAAKKGSEGKSARKIFQNKKTPTANITGSVKPARPFGQAGLVTKKVYSQSPPQEPCGTCGGQGDDDTRLLLIMSNDILKTRIQQLPIYTLIYSLFFFLLLYVIKIYNKSTIEET
jgi:hypothetical protein